MARRGPRKNAEERRLEKENKILGEEVVNKILSAREDELRGMASKNDMDRVILLEELEGDMDVKSLKEQLSTAMTRYRDGNKRLKILSRRIKNALEGMGKDVGSGDLPEPARTPPKGPVSTRN